MFIAALFAIAKLWKQSRCPTTDKWIKKMWYLFMMEFYSATKKTDILSSAGKWMELENTILSEVSQAQKDKSCMLSINQSNADCRPKTNAAVLWHTGHTKGRPCKGQIGQGKETKNLNKVDVLTVQE
jgi:hypothetical protein